MALRTRTNAWLAALATCCGLCTAPTALAQPANDVCSSVQAGGVADIPGGGGTGTADLVTSTNDGTSSCQSSAGKDVYFRFQPSVSGYYSLSTCVTGVTAPDTLISVHTNSCPVSSATQVAGPGLSCVDQGCGSGNLSFIPALFLDSTQTYLIRVALWSSTSTTGTATLTVAGPVVAGACCTTAGVCSQTQQSLCTGTSVFQGVDSTCTANPCPVGACCSTSGGCTTPLQAGCTGTSVFQGAGTTCTPTNSCAAIQGACCSSSGTCTTTLAAGCTTSTSFFRGAGTTCTANPCSDLLGSCCSTTAGTCTRTISQGCASPSVFTLAATCTPTNPCGGACCTGTTCAVRLNAAACTGGGVFTAGALCSPNSCAGACCNGATCTLVAVGTACASGATFIGAGTTCSPNSCLGACCNVAAGTCATSSQAACASGSTWAGINTTCTTNPCPAPVNQTCVVPEPSPFHYAGTGFVVSGQSNSVSFANGTDGSYTGIAGNTVSGCLPTNNATTRGSSRAIYYTFTPSVSTNYNLTLCSSSPSFDSVLSVHTGCGATTANTIACNDDGTCSGGVGLSAIIDLPLTAGQTYVIRVAKFGSTNTTGALFTLSVSSDPLGACCTIATGGCALVTSSACTGPTVSFSAGVTCTPTNPCPPPPPPANDQCSAAEALTLGAAPVPGTLVNSTEDYPDDTPAAFCTGSTFDVYYSVTTTAANQAVRASVFTTATDDLVALVALANCGDQTPLACTAITDDPTMTFTAATPGTYLVRVSAYDLDQVPFTIKAEIVVTGACCNTTTGACTTVVSGTACPSGAVYQNDNSVCSAALCGQGACCSAATGSCSLSTASGCGTGTFSLGMVCADVTCTTTACCNDTTGACTVVGTVPCPAGTTAQAPGTVCGSNPCGLGQCCQPSGSCTITLQAACTGSWNSSVGSTPSCGTTGSPFCPQPPPPANDDCATPTALVVGTPLTGQTITNSAQSATASCTGSTIDVWYLISAPPAGSISVTATPGAPTDAALSLSTWSDCSTQITQTGSCVAQPGNGATSSIIFTADGTSNYLIRAAGFAGNVNTFTISASVANPGRCCNPATGGCTNVTDGVCPSGSTFEAVSTCSTTPACPPPPTPGNDECTGATPVALGANGPYNLAGATNSTTLANPTCNTLSGSPGSYDVFYRFIAPVTAAYTLDTCGTPNSDTVLSIHSGCPSDVNNVLACNDDSTQTGSAACTGSTTTNGSRIVSVTLQAGQTYYIRVAQYGSTLTGFAGNFPFPLNLALVNAVGSCCNGSTCSTTDAANCSGTFTSGGACFPTNPCAPANVVCCRGSTCAFIAPGDCTVVSGSQAGASTYAGTGCNASGNNTNPCCKADYNKANNVELLDIFAFLNDWFGNRPYADFNGANNVDLLDIFAFLGAWFAGTCPPNP